jgi:hypothetical protein
MGVECGGSNVQMAINPVNGDMIIIEMNPRVSRCECTWKLGWECVEQHQLAFPLPMSLGAGRGMPIYCC